MKIAHILCLSFLFLFLSSCWIEAVDSEDPGNGDEEAIFEDVSSSNLPLSVLSGSSTKVHSIDLDQDGDLDLIIAIEFSANRLLFNDGTGNFTDESSGRLPARNFDSKDVAVADFNNDGFPDIFFASEENETNEYYINNRDNSFSDAGGRIPVSGISTAADTGDVDNDGDIDLLIGNLGQNVLLINNGNAFFSNQTAERIPQLDDGTRDIMLVDIDGDGDLDMLAGNEDSNRILINDGNGFFTDETSQRLPLRNTQELTHDVNIADIDGDGDPDIYFGNVAPSSTQADPQDRLLTNNGDGSFTDVTGDQLPVYDTNTVDADFVDINNDGYPDLLVGDIEGNALVLMNDGNGTFSDETENWLPENFRPQVLDFNVADFNGDGLLDIYIGNYQSEDNLLLQQDR